MANISAKINLAKLEKAVIVKGKQGQPLLVLDIQGCNLFEGKDNNGNVYLNLNLWERAKAEDIEKYGLYSVKQNLPKEVRESDKLNDIKRPYLGNAEIMKAAGEVGAYVAPAEEVFEASDESDLPF